MPSGRSIPAGLSSPPLSSSLTPPASAPILCGPAAFPDVPRSIQRVFRWLSRVFGPPSFDRGFLNVPWIFLVLHYSTSHSLLDCLQRLVLSDYSASCPEERRPTGTSGGLREFTFSLEKLGLDSIVCVLMTLLPSLLIGETTIMLRTIMQYTHT